MTALLNWRLLLAILLAGGLALSHFTVYRAGKASVRSAWDAQKLAQIEAARNDEKARNIANQGVDRELQAEKKRRAVAERLAADSLRDFTETLNAPLDTTAASRVAGTGGLERELLGECANSLASLALTADRMEGKIVGLQGYVNQVVKPGK